MSAHPTVDVAKGLARSYGEDGVVVFFVRRDGTFGYTSYGHDRKACGEMRKWAEKVYDFTVDGIIVPPEVGQ